MYNETHGSPADIRTTTQNVSSGPNVLPTGAGPKEDARLGPNYNMAKLSSGSNPIEF